MATASSRQKWQAMRSLGDFDATAQANLMLARYYSPAGTMRFASVDPARESAISESPQTWNRYSYARNNPILRSDHTGRVDNATIRADAKAEGVTWTSTTDPTAQAFERAMGYALAGLVALPVVAMMGPEVAGAMGTGALIGGATAAPQVAGADVPAVQKVDAIAAAAVTGAVTGPISPTKPLIGVPAGAASSLATDVALNQEITLDGLVGSANAGTTGGVAGILTQALPSQVQPFAAAAIQFVATVLTPTPELPEELERE